MQHSHNKQFAKTWSWTQGPHHFTTWFALWSYRPPMNAEVLIRTIRSSEIPDNGLSTVHVLPTITPHFFCSYEESSFCTPHVCLNLVYKLLQLRPEVPSLDLCFRTVDPHPYKVRCALNRISNVQFILPPKGSAQSLEMHHEIQTRIEVFQAFFLITQIT